jgi:hypothetical protein
MQKRILSTGAVLAVVGICACGSTKVRTVTVARQASSAKTTTKGTRPSGCHALIRNPNLGGTCHTGQVTFRTAPMRQYVQLKDVALAVKSIGTAAVISGANGVRTQTAHGVFTILKVRVRDVSHVPLDWGNALDGRTELYAGGDEFSYDGNAASALPGGLDHVGQSIQPGDSADETLVYDVSRKDELKLKVLLFVSTADLNQGLDPTTDTSQGAAKVP